MRSGSAARARLHAPYDTLADTARQFDELPEVRVALERASALTGATGAEADPPDA